MFSLGNLSSMEATAPPQDGVVTVRSPKGGKETRVELALLYLDPEAPKTAPEPAKTASAAAPAAPASAPSPAPSTTASPQYRVWKDSSGKFEIEATLVSFENGLVRLLRKDGKEISLPLSRLSEADQTFVEKSLSESSNPFEP
jgi:hypothetical protein